MRRVPTGFVLLALSACQASPQQPETPPSATASVPVARCQASSGGHCIAVVAVGKPDSPLADARAVTERDLLHSGPYTALDAQSFPEKPDWTQPLHYAQWKALGVDYVILQGPADSAPGLQTVGTSPGANPSALHLRIADIRQEKITWLTNLPLPPGGNVTLAGHQSSDLILQQLTGIRGVAATSIAYVAVAQPGRNASYKLLVSNVDGEDEKVIAESRDPLMSPAWSPDAKRIAYGGYDAGRSAVYVHDLETGKTTRLISEKGINGSPAWSPDGKTLALTLSFGRNPDIYFIDIASGTRRRITTDAGIETEVSWSPDGRSIAFTSDRGGVARVYTMSVDGGTARQLPAYGKQTSNPSYSPDGKSIAVVVDQGRDSRIGLYNLDSGSFEFISGGPRDEKPSFAPNGAMLVYAAEDARRGQLKIRALGGVLRQLHADEDVREPAWSPYRN
ncbi:DPP IV N-terminal domain-containing protein [Nevskia soli]|uniref:DPP IV N-terminal domain-containing protein n=1 Tax=Nevskia soli TaxID=418856 RepID=UPI000691583F|nr:DPP IV N-terminal domain-containing protein [Nevskia soli]